MALVGTTQYKHKPIPLGPSGEVKTSGALVRLAVPELWTGEGLWIWEIGGRREYFMFSPPAPVKNVHVVVVIESEKLGSGEQRLREVFSKDLDCKPSPEMLKLLVVNQQDHENYCRIRTTDWKGMRVAVFEYKNEKERKLEYRIDVRGTGLNLQGLYYTAPIDDFERYYKTAFEVFESSEWRADFQPLEDTQILT